MIQSVLFFVLGFLSALFIALLLLPAVWHRAVRLTRRGIERTMPLSLDEIRASQDQFRAQHAVAARRLEIERDEAQRKSAALTVETARQRRKIERLTAERAELKERLKQAQTQAASVQEELQLRDQLAAQFAEAEDDAAPEQAERRPAEEPGDAEDGPAGREQVVRPRESAAPAADDDLRLVDLQKKHLRLAAALEALRDPEARRGAARPEDDRLRETMHDLAAEVVNMVAATEEHAEPIEKALALPSATRGGRRHIMSLAERIRSRRASPSA